MSTLKFLPAVLLIWTISPVSIFGQPGNNLKNQQVVIEWSNVQSRGTVEVLNGQLSKIEILEGKGIVNRASFDLDSKKNCRILATVTHAKDNPGSDPTILTVKTDHDPFSFFLRDVSK